MRAVSIEELRDKVSKLQTSQRVADYYRVSIEVAERMINLANRKTHEFNEPVPVVMRKARPPKTNPKTEPQEWAFQRDKMSIEKGSRNLLIAMLTSGQHWLTDEKAIAKAQELGLLPYSTTT